MLGRQRSGAHVGTGYGCSGRATARVDYTVELLFGPVFAHSFGMSIVSTLALLGDPKGCITHVFSRGKAGTGVAPPAAEALVAPSSVCGLQLTNCTTLAASPCGFGMGRLSK